MGHLVPRMEPLSSCDPPLSATADTQPPRALHSMHCQPLPGDTGDQAVAATWLGQVPAKEASAPWEEKLTSQLAATKLEGTARGLATLSLSSQACMLRKTGEKRPADSLPSPFQTPQLLFPTPWSLCRWLSRGSCGPSAAGTGPPFPTGIPSAP